MGGFIYLKTNDFVFFLIELLRRFCGANFELEGRT